MEACLAEPEPYVVCSSRADMLQDDVVPQPGDSAQAYTLTRSSASASSTDFRITKSGSGSFARRCAVAMPGGLGDGGCPADGLW